MRKLVFVLVDGLNAEAASCMGYMGALQAAGAVYGEMDCELPPLSRPVYATLFTGLTPLQAGVTHNGAAFLTPEVRESSLFALLRNAGKQSAAAAYHWMRELYTGEPWQGAQHRLTLDDSLPLQQGVFYNNDAYPDDHVLMDAEALRQRHTPHMLLIHSMGVDNAGHCYGADSANYRNAARHLDMLLAVYVPLWLQDGYAVIVTSDHGMHADAAHNDVTADVRRVPFWMVGQELITLAVPQRQTEWYTLMRAYLEV